MKFKYFNFEVHKLLLLDNITNIQCILYHDNYIIVIRTKCGIYGKYIHHEGSGATKGLRGL